MLRHFRLQNLAIVEEAQIAFGEGLNVITGETGAGKSILIGALELILGGRADKTLIRSGATEALVEASFELSDCQAVDAVLAEAGLPACEDNSLIIRRTLTATGAGRCLLNDAATTVQTLRKIGDLLVDIHGPYDHQSLLDPAFQLELLDAFGRCHTARETYQERFRARQDLEQRRAALAGDSTDVAAEIERLRFVVDEISSAKLTPADDEELINEHAAAANAETILQTGGALVAALTEGDESVFDRLAGTQQRLAELARILPEAAEWRQEAQTAAVQIQELSRVITDRMARIETDANRLQELETRMALVQKLKRKHGPALTDVHATLERQAARLEDLQSRGDRLAALEKELAAAQKQLVGQAAVLTRAREAASGNLAKAITRELRDLGFRKAGFGVEIIPCPPRLSGADDVRFGFAPNPGETMRPLRDIASSGEISRVMLAVKAVLARHDRIPVLVFDEIDSNIGGEVGRAVGIKLQGVAATHQTLCITHLPQVAVYGTRHLVVDKEVRNGRTFAKIAVVEKNARVEEIARMLGGRDSTSVILEHARELLAACRK
ncbi:MAG: DNA repair protein RecN [Kiritimatiellia bacterium]